MNRKKFTNEIIEILSDQGIKIENNQVINTIDSIILDAMEEAKKDGVKEGKGIGIAIACREFEVKIASIRNKAIK